MAREPKKVTLKIQFPVSDAAAETLSRIEKVTKPPEQIASPVTRGVLYLRAAAGRSSLALASFYQFLVAECSTDEERKQWTYPQQVKHSTLRFSAVSTLALSVRAIYDHGKDVLCPRTIVDASPSNFTKIAEYWAKRSGRDIAEATRALEVVQEVLARCAIPLNLAKKSQCRLARRVAFLKALADRESAHITVHHYEYTLIDVAHVVAVTAILGALIHNFDYPKGSGPDYLEKLDKAAHEAAADSLPHSLKLLRIFDGQDFNQLLRTTLNRSLVSGAEFLSYLLPSALGLEGIPKEIAEAMIKNSGRRVSDNRP